MKNIIVAILIATSSVAMAAEAPPLKQKAVDLPDPALVQKVESYLNSIKTLEADFKQMSSGGELASGRFYLSRPGKFRWEYLEGQQVLIISNGSQIVYYDRKLDEVTHIPMQYSIASFLAEEHIKLSGKIKLISIKDNGMQVQAIVTQKDKPDEGTLVMYFDKEPMKLTQLEVIDQDKNITVVSLKNQKFNQPIAKDQFVFKDRKFYKNVWDKK